MNATNEMPSPRELIEKGLPSCREFVRGKFPTPYDWGQLAERLAARARSFIALGEQPQDAGLGWVSLAIELYERMAAQVAAESSKVRFLMSAIGLRAHAIKTWGDSQENEALRLEEIERAFCSIVKIPPQELLSNAVPRDEAVRNALEVTRYLAPLGEAGILKDKLPKVFEYYEAARTSRGAVGKD